MSQPATAESTETKAKPRQKSPTRRHRDYVDELGEVKAKLSKLRKEEERMSDLIKRSGFTEIDGAKYRATVSKSERTILDMDALRASTSARAKWVLQNFSRTTQSTMLKVVARKTS